MGTATGYTKEHQDALAAQDIVGARISGTNLILTTRGGVDLNLGNVKGADGLNALMWGTANQINTVGNSQAGIAKDDVAGQSIKVGDLIVSRHASSDGLYGRVTAVASQSSVTVLTLGSVKGPTGAPANLDGATLTNSAVPTNATSFVLKNFATASSDTTAGMHDTGNGCINVLATGTYLVGASMKVPTWASAHVSSIAVMKGIIAYNVANELCAANTHNTNEVLELNCSARVPLTAGDKVAFYSKFDTNTAASFGSARLWVQRIK